MLPVEMQERGRTLNASNRKLRSCVVRVFVSVLICGRVLGVCVRACFEFVPV